MKKCSDCEAAKNPPINWCRFGGYLIVALIAFVIALLISWQSTSLPEWLKIITCLLSIISFLGSALNGAEGSLYRGKLTDLLMGLTDMDWFLFLISPR
jgi:hypothetical protein